MKFTIIAVAAVAGMANAQLTFDNGVFTCNGDAADKDFCGGDSLETNIIIRCTGSKGQPGNCNDNLAGVPPIGVKSSALCYQTTNSTGDAVCSFNGIGYRNDGTNFTIGSGSSSSASVSTATATSTSYSVSLYPTSTIIYETSASSKNTVTGTVTITTCTTSSANVPTGTGGQTYPTGNVTYTTGLPVPTPAPNSAAVVAKGSLFAGLLAVAGALLL